MCSKSATYRIVDGIRPIVRVELGNPHDLSIAPVPFPALIDTGSPVTVVPAYLCRALGHSFEDGLSASSATGIGEGIARTFTHSTRLTVLYPATPDAELDADTQPAFDPVEFSCGFIDQFLPFILLGQQDFLRLFRYAQDGHAGWFSLEQIAASQGKAAK